MAPKRVMARPAMAKAKAAVAAKGRPAPKAKGAARRARAAVGRVPLRRRPASAGVPRDRQGEGWRELGSLALGELKQLGTIWLRKALYYQKEIDVVAQVKQVKMEGDQHFLEAMACGTQDEGLLRAVSGRGDRFLAVHICGPDCTNALTGDNVLHGKEFKAVQRDGEAWYTNLMEVRREGEEDEMRRLREAGEALEPEGEGEDPPKTKKAKKEKRKKEEGEKEKEKKKKKKGSDSEEGLEVGQKKVSALFEKTGLDPDVKARRKVLRKARKLGQGKKKKKKKKSSSEEGSSSGSSTTEEGEDDGGTGLFNNEQRVRTIWHRCPGALSATMLQEARNSLVTSSGSLWEVDKAKLPPIVGQYVRTTFHGHMQPAMYQEACTLGLVADLLLQGHAAKSLDVVSQRLKSLEGTSRGSHWSVGRQLELARSDAGGITEETESWEAAKKAREEERLRGMMRGPVVRNYDNQQGKGKKNGKDKGTGRGGYGDSGRGKGGDGNKDDKGGWSKDKKKS